MIKFLKLILTGGESTDPEVNPKADDDDGDEAGLKYNEDGDLDVEYVDGDDDESTPEVSKTEHKANETISIDDTDDADDDDDGGDDDEDYSEGSGHEPSPKHTSSTSTTTTTTTTRKTTTPVPVVETSSRATTSKPRAQKVPFQTDDEDLVEGSGSSGGAEIVESGSGSSEDELSSVSGKIPPAEVERVRIEFSEDFGVDIFALDSSCVTRFVAAPEILHATMQ